MKKYRLIITLVQLFLLIPPSFLSAQEGYVPAPQNLANREWFQDAKFGLFIHWGVYSIMAGGGDQGIAEWIMNQKEIPIEDYEKLPGFFYPVAFDPVRWVSLAKKAGMKYITITSKHHDGFAMFDSPVSDYDVVDATPFGKDVLGLLKKECDRQGIRLFFYYSQLDWHHPDYYPRGRTGRGYTGRPDSGNWDHYIRYMNTQLSELLGQYGDIGGIWFDGMWDKPDADWHLSETYALIHRLQPGALIGSNHHRTPFPGEDFMMFERDLPGENSMGFNNTDVPEQTVLEMCETMNGSWGFNLVDRNYKPVSRIIQTMVRAAGYGSNFLLNTGPMPSGMIQPENVDTLLAIGRWMDRYGETIYGTRKGPVAPGAWGALTTKGDRVYAHILDPSDGEIHIGGIQGKVKSARYFDDGSDAGFTQNGQELILTIPAEKIKPVDTIVELAFK